MLEVTHLQHRSRIGWRRPVSFQFSKFGCIGRRFTWSAVRAFMGWMTGFEPAYTRVTGEPRTT
jgi:hypothetical protein